MSSTSACRRVSGNLALFVSALLLPLLVFEVLLRATTLFDQLERAAPSYLPRKLHKLEERINDTGFISADGFRTTTRVANLLDKLKHDPGCKVVVLGDSFVWGFGLEPQQRWTDQLEKLIDCTVYPFGKSGWSSLEYFSYYQQHLADVPFDFLLIGVVSNDPHPRGVFAGYGFATDPMLLSDAHDLARLVGFSPLHKLRRPLKSYDYINQIIKNVLDARTAPRGSLAAPPIIAYGYAAWERRLYEDDIYTLWIAALREFSNIVRHTHGFLLTPTANTPQDRVIWDQIAGTFAAERLVFRNTYPPLDRLFDCRPRPRSAWANPADPHPGEAQMVLYAQEAQLLLQTLGHSRPPTAAPRPRYDCKS